MQLCGEGLLNTNNCLTAFDKLKLDKLRFLKSKVRDYCDGLSLDRIRFISYGAVKPT
jgi:hypothetical protein